jgi:hypothetical protein
MHTMTCGYLWCGQEFTAQRSTAKYCSSDCRVAAFHQRERQRERDRIEEERARENRFCENGLCTTIIEGWSNRPDKKYCSNACKQMAWRDGMSTPRTSTYGNIFALLEETNAKA